MVGARTPQMCTGHFAARNSVVACFCVRPPRSVCFTRTQRVCYCVLCCCTLFPCVSSPNGWGRDAVKREREPNSRESSQCIRSPYSCDRQVDKEASHLPNTFICVFWRQNQRILNFARAHNVQSLSLDPIPNICKNVNTKQKH